MAKTTFDIAALARQAHITLEASERAGMQARLQELLATAEAVRAVDTEGVAPMLHPQSAMGALQLRLHDDIASEPDQREANQRNAPATHNGLYLVPRVIE